MADYEAQLKNAYQVKVVEISVKTDRAVALVVDSVLVQTTPVDEGRARSNWNPSLNVPDGSIREPKQKKSIEPILDSYKITDTILISNNLPYIKRLNDGYSKQAPAGFVDAALARGKRAVKK